jgi:hypothetical protein
MANQGTGSLFISAEKLASLARCSCLILWVTPLPTFVKVVEGCVIFNFALDHKVHFSSKMQRKFNLKTASAKYKRPGNAETRLAVTSCTATSASRRTRRTRVGHARRGTGVTVGHCAAPAGAHPCRPWQVDRARWRRSTGRRTAVVRHWPPERRTSPAISRPLHACASRRRYLTGS